MVINELRGKVTAKDTRITKLAKYEDIIVKMVRRVQKDAGNALE
mgnify:FL=1